MKRLTLGILAHVDAGKTTLAEAMLYKSGVIRNAGRVDKGDAFLDTYAIEKDRGITVFSKQAELAYGDLEVSLLDTPGHIDFSAEMERTLSVLDGAILVISGADGVQGHTVTLMRLLDHYGVPVTIFVNKMDQAGTDGQKLMKQLQKFFGDGCISFTDLDSIDREGGVYPALDLTGQDIQEELAMTDEDALEKHLEGQELTQDDIGELVAGRKVFPVYFGAALKMQGVEELMTGLELYMKEPDYETEFGARVFKIARDERGERISYLKITGGSLKARENVSGRIRQQSTDMDLEEDDQGDQEIPTWTEKVNQIRVYSGVKYETLNEAAAGRVVAVTGLAQTYPGAGLGAEPDGDDAQLAPILNYDILLPADVDSVIFLGKLRQLEEEDPQLHILWNERNKTISAQLMGDIQIEILKSQVKERFDTDIDFGQAQILYKETIASQVEGVGHFEPLRHYAEVHLLMEPLPAGSGIEITADCSEDILDKNWQRLIMGQLRHKRHLGVLTGSPLTDVKLTVVSGRAHNKHTEGGDFRKAAYRAVRQGLMEADSILLEPFYEFEMTIPADQIGRAMTDIEKMRGELNPPETDGETAFLNGTIPVSTIADYQKEFMSYTKGMGQLNLRLKGYYPCHNTEEVVEKIGYDPERDVKNPSSSVFVAHGETSIVPWNEAKPRMHMPCLLSKEGGLAENIDTIRSTYEGGQATDQELLDIFQRTYGNKAHDKAQNLDGYFLKKNNQMSIRNYEQEMAEAKEAARDREAEAQAEAKHSHELRRRQEAKNAGEFLLVDGYNIIFAWEELKELADHNINSARDKLQDILCNYQGYRGMTLILVFDAYRVPDHNTEVMEYHNIHVVYTKEAETADQYIEKLAMKLRPENHVRVATSDNVEQVIVSGQGCEITRAEYFHKEVMETVNEIRQEHLDRQVSGKAYLLDDISQDLKDQFRKLDQE